MLTLKEIVETERRVLLDNSAFGFENNISAETMETKVGLIIDAIEFFDSVHVLPDTLDEISKLRRALNSSKKRFRIAIKKREASETHFEIKAVYDEICSRLCSAKKLISCLKRKSFPAYDIPKFASFSRVVPYFEKTFRVKKERSDNKTDEMIVAAALFLTAYGTGSTAVVTGDSDITRLLKCSMDILARPELEPDAKNILARARQQESGIKVYFRLPADNQPQNCYEIKFDSRKFIPLKVYNLSRNHIEAIRHYLQAA